MRNSNQIVGASMLYLKQRAPALLLTDNFLCGSGLCICHPKKPSNITLKRVQTLHYTIPISTLLSGGGPLYFISIAYLSKFTPRKRGVDPAA